MVRAQRQTLLGLGGVVPSSYYATVFPESDIVQRIITHTSIVLDRPHALKSTVYGHDTIQY